MKQSINKREKALQSAFGRKNPAMTLVVSSLPEKSFLSTIRCDDGSALEKTFAMLLFERICEEKFYQRL